MCLGRLRQLLFLVLVSGTAFSQTNEEVFREYQFNFNLPGARANGMGGAFIGVADDATASFSNPAGLAFLSETAVTLEYRSRRLDAVTGEIVGNFNTQFEQEAAALDDASFFSLNFRRGAWFFGVFQYRYLDESQNRSLISRSLSGTVQRIENRDIMLDLQGLTRGVGIARRFGAFKLGLTVNHFNMEGETRYRREGFLITPPFQSTTFSYESDIDDSDDGWGYSLGVLHEPGPRWSWGAVWREHPNFTLTERVLEFVNDEPVLVDNGVQVPFVVPNVLGFGARFKVRNDFGLLLDWQKIFYSAILEDGFVIVEAVTEDDRANYSISDQDQIHAGFEWFIPGRDSIWTVRGGYWYNPTHAVTYRGDDPAIQDRFAGTGISGEHHYTLGLGWAFQNRLELSVAGNRWQAGHEITVSLIWRKK